MFLSALDTSLSIVDWTSPNILYQKRHLLAHNEGIVDSQYIKKSGDLSYKEGQRIVVSGKDIDNLVSSIEKLANGIKEICDRA